MIAQRVPVGTAQPTAHELRPGYCCRSLSASPVILRSYSLPRVPRMRWGMIPSTTVRTKIAELAISPVTDLVFVAEADLESCRPSTDTATGRFG
jgi:hypothetical protein